MNFGVYEEKYFACKDIVELHEVLTSNHCTPYSNIEVLGEVYVKVDDKTEED